MFLRRYADGIEASPARLQQIEERLALLERLKRKHGPTLADVIAKRDALRRELAELAGGDERLAELERAHAAARGRYLEAATTLGGERRRRMPGDFARELEAMLGELAMERTRFEVRFNEAPTCCRRGSGPLRDRHAPSSFVSPESRRGGPAAGASSPAASSRA